MAPGPGAGCGGSLRASMVSKAYTWASHESNTGRLPKCNRRGPSAAVRPRRPALRATPAQDGGWRRAGDGCGALSARVRDARGGAERPVPVRLDRELGRPPHRVAARPIGLASEAARKPRCRGAPLDALHRRRGDGSRRATGQPPDLRRRGDPPGRHHAVRGRCPESSMSHQRIERWSDGRPLHAGGGGLRGREMNERHQRDLAVRLPEPVGLLESQAVRLSRYLADSIYLYAWAKRSVKGQQSVALHELFDRVAEAVEEAVVELVKRAVTPGWTADDTLHSVAGRTKRAGHPADSTAGTEHVGRLAAALATYARNDRTATPARTTRPTWLGGAPGS